MQTNGQLELAVTKIRRENLTNKESKWIFIEKTEILYKKLFELHVLFVFKMTSFSIHICTRKYLSLIVQVTVLKE